MDKNIFIPERKNYIELGDIYFWTATINNWQRLLETEDYKKIIINSLSYLSDTGKIDVYAFVIMPNHIHLIWRVKELNGKETAQVFFLKYTAHEFKKQLIKEGYGLINYLVNVSNKKYEFWQRDSLAIHLFREKVAYQKLDYLHYNPCAEHWQLVKDPVDYYYSSASFYFLGEKKFDFLKDLRLEFCVWFVRTRTKAKN